MLLQELIQPNDFVKIGPPECVKIEYNGKHGFVPLVPWISYLGVTPRICLKPSVLLTKYVKKTGSWDPINVNSILRLVQKFPEATFLGSTKYF